MFKKILIANRGEIGVRVVRTCREMGISTVALYTVEDRGSLHVRLADECVQLNSAADFMNPALILEIAQAKNVDAIHPGYGYLAEESSFIHDCEAAGVTFIGPPADVVAQLRDKTSTLEIARAAGFPTLRDSGKSFGTEDYDELATAAANLGYPVIIKSCIGGRGRGEQLATSAKHLPEAVRQAQVTGQSIYGNRRVYLEKAILPAHQVGVQIMADGHGNLVHLGDREGSILQKAKKIIEEAPAVCLNETQRARILEVSLELARLFNYQNVGTVEFIVDVAGNFYFSEIKARIQVEHTLTEMLTRIDLIREQIRIAAGEKLPLTQEDVWLGGHAMLCRVRASDPWRNYLPSPGQLQRVRLPAGPEVRVDTYVYCQCAVPPAYDPLFAKLTVWDKNRDKCRRRLARSLEDFNLLGTPTNLPLLQYIVHRPEFVAGNYSTDFRPDLFDQYTNGAAESHLRDLAIATAVMYVRRNQMFLPQSSERLEGGWHRSSRRVPQ